jgi:hypothetical protein
MIADPHDSVEQSQGRVAVLLLSNIRSLDQSVHQQHLTGSENEPKPLTVQQRPDSVANPWNLLIMGAEKHCRKLDLRRCHVQLHMELETMKLNATMGDSVRIRCHRIAEPRWRERETPKIDQWKAKQVSKLDSI